MTANAEDNEGSIVQTVIVKVPNDAKDAHAGILLLHVKALTRWIHSAVLFDQGYLTKEDCPQ